MVHLAAIICFALAVVFDAWNIQHGAWNYVLFLLLGLLLWCISAKWDRAI